MVLPLAGKASRLSIATARTPDEHSMENITHWISNGSQKRPKRGKPRVYSTQK